MQKIKNRKGNVAGILQQFTQNKRTLNNLIAKRFLSPLFVVFFVACNSTYVPKPKGYYQIPLPPKAYRLFNEPGYPYSFEYPVYADIKKDSSFFGEAPENPWWINISFPQFGGRLYITYKAVGKNAIEKLVNDAFNMTNKHTVKASGIDNALIATPNNIHGMFFKVQGDVATANQFFLTDSTTHFLRGALYFDATPNQDSIRPVNDFLLKDMQHLIASFRWK